MKPVIDQFNSVAMTLEKEEFCSVDENTIPYKGRKSKLRQYNPKKPKKWGCKLYMICTGELGLIIGTNLYAGKQTSRGESADCELPKSSQVVWDLAQVLDNDKNYKIAFDNWFSSPVLMHRLLQRGIQSICTFQINRFKGLTFPDDKEMKNLGRGTFFEKQGYYDTSLINAVKWYDNRPVYLASTYQNSQPACDVKRWDFTENIERDIKCPAIVPEYNRFMGQTDNIGRLLSLYRIKIDCRKRFNLKIFFHYCDLAVINSWLLYRRDSKECYGDEKTIDLWDFKSRVASSLCATNTEKKRTVGRPRFSEVEYGHLLKRKRGPVKPIPEKEIRSDNYAHWPIFVEKRGRCKFPDCKGLIQTQCEKCDTYLCFTKDKNCFKNFHVK